MVQYLSDLILMYILRVNIPEEELSVVVVDVGVVVGVVDTVVVVVPSDVVVVPVQSGIPSL